MRKHLVRALYGICKFIGFFHIARYLTRSELRILCYHGFVLADEDQFRKGLFLARETFEERIRFLREKNFPILPLGEAIECLRKGTLPPNAVAVTIDDGFYSVFAIALNILRKYEIPATLYLTSYYFIKGTPIFDLVVAYMCWKSTRDRIDLSGLDIPELSNMESSDFTHKARDAIRARIVAFGNEMLDASGRVSLSHRLGERLGVDYTEIAENRILSLVTPEELITLQDAGIEVGLHTHRHRFPVDVDSSRTEIAENRAAVEPVTGKTMDDFCYPSGDWSREHWPVLQDSGVMRATTCESGLVYSDTAALALPRILDDSRVSKIEFEAHIYGLSEVIRRVRGRHLH